MTNVAYGQTADCRDVTEIRSGDMIRTGSNATPLFRVVAVHEDQVWVRDEHGRGDYIVPKARCSPVN